MISKIKFHFFRLYIHLFVFGNGLINKPWRKIHGVYLPLKQNIGFNTLRWIVNGRYEEGEIKIINERLKETDIVLEIGTGLGFVSTFCCKRVGSENVFTFEANPVNVFTARKVFLKNSVNPYLRNALLANVDGEIEFPIDKKNRLASSFFAENKDTVLIETVKLNDIIASMKPNFLIMDIEGGEYDIFKIIQFQSIRKIQFELHPQILGNKKCREIFKILEENAFKNEDNLSDDRIFYFQKII